MAVGPSSKVQEKVSLSLSLTCVELLAELLPHEVFRHVCRRGDARAGPEGARRGGRGVSCARKWHPQSTKTDGAAPKLPNRTVPKRGLDAERERESESGGERLVTLGCERRRRRSNSSRHSEQGRRRRATAAAEGARQPCGKGERKSGLGCACVSPSSSASARSLRAGGRAGGRAIRFEIRSEKGESDQRFRVSRDPPRTALAGR